MADAAGAYEGAYVPMLALDFEDGFTGDYKLDEVFGATEIATPAN